MPTFRPPCSLLSFLAAALVLAACSGEAPPNETSAGSLLLQLELAAGVEISEVRWEISGADMEPMAGVIDTSAPGATASVEVFGLPPGQGYLVALEATTIDPEVACGGDAFFDVEAGASTEVMVMLNCKPPERLGGVGVNGELNLCPELTKVVVSPLQTSIGDEITLSATAFDPEGDPITFFWFGGRGEIADSSAPSTTYTCERVGEHAINVWIRDDSFACSDYWSVEVKCVHGDPAFEMCAPAERQCKDGGLFPTRPCCEHSVPQQQDACVGDESLSNPTSCTPTGNELTHTLTRLELAPSCHLGYDLDSCDGATCMVGGLAPGEGTDGVDNALTGIGPLLSGVGANLSDLDQALSDGLCGMTKSIQGQQCAAAITPTEVQLVVDANLEEGCANVRVLSSGVEASQVILNLGQPTESGTVCASGALGTVPLHLLGAPAALDNAVVRMTMSDEGFSTGVMGATIDSDDAVAFAEVILPGLGAVFGQVFDVNGDLTQDTSNRCNALSAAFLIGGRTGTVIDPGSPVIPYDRSDRTTVAPFPDDYYLFEDPSTATGYRYSGPIPEGEVDVQVLYAALSAEARMVDGFSPVGGIVIPLDVAPDEGSLPRTPEASLEPTTTVGLFDVTPASETFGNRVPFKLSALSRALGRQPIDHSLVLYPSIPLSPKGRYALVVTRDALTRDGRPLEPSPFMTAALGPEQTGEMPEVTRARALLADGVLDVLTDPSHVSPPIEADDIALVTRITIRSMDDITRRPLSMKEQILTRPLPSFTVASVDPGFGNVAAVVRGTWEAPNWREDQYFIASDENGDPRITGTLDVPFVLALPHAAEDGPVPVVMFQHGGPGSAEDVVWEAEAAGLAEAGFAVIGMTDTLNREVGLNGDEQSALLFTTLIQQWRFPHFAAQTLGDQMAFLRFLEGLGSLDEVPLSGGDGIPDLDLQAPLTYVGISIGSMQGSALLSYAPELKAAALAVGSQRQGEQYFREGDFLNIFPPGLAELIPNATPRDYWLALSIFQMIFDHQDAHHQTPYLYRNRLEVAGTTRKASVLVVEGLADTQVPNNATRSLAWTFGPIPHLAPIWQASPILEQVIGPVTGNIDSETTAAFYQFVPFGVADIPHTPGCQFEPEGHFCGQSSAEARLQRLLFLKSAVEDPVPTIVDPLSVVP